jgi:hypothetical protein
LEACTEEEELEFLRVAYLKIPPKISKRVPGLSDFEEYKERHKCKCNLHDESNSVKLSGEFFTKCVRAAVHNIIDEMRRDIYTLIRTGEIQETEYVRKVLSLFEWED